jgi:hypothetical protein
MERKELVAGIRKKYQALRSVVITENSVRTRPASLRF